MDLIPNGTLNALSDQIGIINPCFSKMIFQNLLFFGFLYNSVLHIFYFIHKRKFIRKTSYCHISDQIKVYSVLL